MYFPEEVIDRKLTTGNIFKYLVKWFGFLEKTWEPLINLKDYGMLVQLMEHRMNYKENPKVVGVCENSLDLDI